MNKLVSDLEFVKGAMPVKRPAALKTKRDLRKLGLYGLAAIAVIGIASYGAEWWSTARWLESTDDAYIGGNVTSISPHVSGFVSQILVDDNQRVRAGQVLVRLDNRDFQAAKDHAEAVVKARRAALDNLKAKYTLQESAIRQAKADLEAKTAEATFTSQDAERYRRLLPTSAGSRQIVQKAVAADKQAVAAVAASMAGFDAARQQLKVLDSDIDEAKASLAQARADLRTADLDLGYTEIRSPIDGYVGNRAAQVGAYVSNGAYLLTVVPARDLWVDANFKEDQLKRMKPGEPARVVADVMPGHVLNGHVESVAPAAGSVFSVIPAENATGNFTKIVRRVPVRIRLDASDAEFGTLRPGLSTTVTVDTRTN